MSPFAALAVALGLTLALELPVAAAFRLGKKGILVCLLVNLLTNPLANVLNALLTLYAKLPSIPVVIAIEAAVFVTEGFFYKRAAEARLPYLVSLIANAVSFGLGMIILKYIF